MRFASLSSRIRGWCRLMSGYDPEMRVVYFKSEDDGDGTFDGQIGHA